MNTLINKFIINNMEQIDSSMHTSSPINLENDHENQEENGGNKNFRRFSNSYYKIPNFSNLIKQHKDMCYLTTEFSFKSKGIYGRMKNNSNLELSPSICDKENSNQLKCYRHGSFTHYVDNQLKNSNSNQSPIVPVTTQLLLSKKFRHSSLEPMDECLATRNECSIYRFASKRNKDPRLIGNIDYYKKNCIFKDLKAGFNFQTPKASQRNAESLQFLTSKNFGKGVTLNKISLSKAHSQSEIKRTKTENNFQMSKDLAKEIDDEARCIMKNNRSSQIFNDLLFGLADEMKLKRDEVEIKQFENWLCEVCPQISPKHSLFTKQQAIIHKINNHSGGKYKSQNAQEECHECEKNARNSIILEKYYQHIKSKFSESLKNAGGRGRNQMKNANSYQSKIEKALDLFEKEHMKERIPDDEKNKFRRITLFRKLKKQVESNEKILTSGKTVGNYEDPSKYRKEDGITQSISNKKLLSFFIKRYAGDQQAK